MGSPEHAAGSARDSGRTAVEQAVFQPGDRVEVTVNPSGYTWSAMVGVRGFVLGYATDVFDPRGHWKVRLDCQPPNSAGSNFSPGELKRLSILELMVEAMSG